MEVEVAPRMSSTPRRYAFLAAMIAALAGAPAHAGEDRDLVSPFDARLIESLISPRALLGEVVTEQDLDLVLAHVKATLLAAAAGAAPPPVPPELHERADAITRALRTRGTLAALVLLEALEASARRELRELERRPEPPPTSPRPARWI